MTTALIAVDVQKDFLPGGSLAVADGDRIIDPLVAVAGFADFVVATRDHHPRDHISFTGNGGVDWPPHCIRGTEGAKLHPRIDAISDIIVSKGTDSKRDAYSGFEGTHLAAILRACNPDTVVVAGLATDYCVLNTVLDARKEGFNVVVVSDAIAAVNVNPADGEAAIAKMKAAGLHSGTVPKSSEVGRC